MKCDIPNVTQYEDRHGKLRTRYRKYGVTVQLPDPAHKDFPQSLADAITKAQNIKDGVPEKEVYKNGTIGFALERYYNSPKFKNLKPKTQNEYKNALNRLLAKNKKAEVSKLTDSMVEAMQVKMEATPAMANATMRYFRTFLAYCIKPLQLISQNPASSITMYEIGEWRSWSIEECERFEAYWPVGTLQRWIYTVARYTSQRIGDVVRMSRHDIRDGFIRVIQEKGRGKNKTGEEMWIFIHDEILTGLNHLPSDQIAFFITERGRLLKEDRASKIMAAAIKEAGLSKDCVVHGLRKRGATDLADSGANDREIMSVTGHKTTAMVGKYTRAADQRKRSKDAITRFEENRK
ncbi:tyrosine-type recombinase/integrase [Lentilitoribacter sp. Alg239-R112]|uniref:tyrosine-type recombinase/integrase n=1 Tax=Lentilitoribacter sp. Alg239-R112 TaxID=2305987 RepID=UPI001FCE367B|nr:tyrosine-type recombinase/integrase [Lentilitoribacter sp. Alg239-R112]